MPWRADSGNGHSTGVGGAQMLEGWGLSAVTVAIRPRGYSAAVPVCLLPASVLKGVGPFCVNRARAVRAIRSRWTS